jgi:hypothetical protein
MELQQIEHVSTLAGMKQIRDIWTEQIGQSDRSENGTDINFNMKTLNSCIFKAQNWTRSTNIHPRHNFISIENLMIPI